VRSAGDSDARDSELVAARCGSHWWEDKVKCVSAWVLGQVDLLGQIAPVGPSGLPFIDSLFKSGKEKEYILKKGKEKEQKRFEHLIT
jgi:hypothetical protein